MRLRRWHSRLERLPRTWKAWCSNPSRDTPKLLKQAVTGVCVTGPRKDHYYRMSRVTLMARKKKPHCSMAKSAEYR